MPRKPDTYRSGNEAQHSQWHRHRRETRQAASQRGYDATWRKLRQAYIAEQPLCELCQRLGITCPAKEVDHITPFEGLDDPLRLDWDNLQSLCRACHAAKTWADKRQG